MENDQQPASLGMIARRDVLAAGAIVAAAAALPNAAPSFAAPISGDRTMGTVTTKDGSTIFYKDWGAKTAQPIVFHHGWPLTADDWDNQMMVFLQAGYRVIAHDRRGHGR